MLTELKPSQGASLTVDWGCKLSLLYLDYLNDALRLQSVIERELGDPKRRAPNFLSALYLAQHIGFTRAIRAAPSPSDAATQRRNAQHALSEHEKWMAAV